jgi:DNA-binding NarL/FixJ family response regulator
MMKRKTPSVACAGRIRTHSRPRNRRIFVVERNLLMRTAIASWVNRFPDLRVCGEAATQHGAEKAIDQLHPDLVVTEILRKQDVGFIRSLHRRHPRLPILVFSIQDEARYATRALAAGACGYLVKGVDGPGLVNGIRAALKLRAWPVAPRHEATDTDGLESLREAE